VKQTRARVFDGNTKFEEKLVSVFEPTAVRDMSFEFPPKP
jgi:hypothetical protein